MPIFQLKKAAPCFPAIGTYWIAPTATIVGDVRVASGVSVWFGSVIRGDNDPITIGEDSNIQDCCVLHSDPGVPLKIGTSVTVGHNVILHGCQIGNNSLIGMGAVVLNGAQIGQNCLIGARTLITERKVIPDNSVVIGSPGKIIRQITPEESRLNIRSSQSYITKWRRYKATLSA